MTSVKINLSDCLANRIYYDMYLFKNRIWDRNEGYIDDNRVGFVMYQCNLTVTVSGKSRLEEFEARVNDVLGQYYTSQQVTFHAYQFAGHRRRYNIFMKFVPDYIDPAEAKVIAADYGDYTIGYIFVPYHELSDVEDNDHIFNVMKQAKEIIDRLVGPCWQ